MFMLATNGRDMELCIGWSIDHVEYPLCIFERIVWDKLETWSSLPREQSDSVEKRQVQRIAFLEMLKLK